MALRAANEFGFVNARIRGMKSRFLGIGTYESLVQADSYQDFIKILSGTYYGSLIARFSSGGVPRPDELALILAQDYADVSFNLSRTLTGKVKGFTDTYLVTFYAESIKSIIRGLHVGLDKEEILRFSVASSPSQETLFENLADTASVHKMIDLLPQWDLRVSLLTRIPTYQDFDSTAPLEVAVEEWYLRKVEAALKKFNKSDRDRVYDILGTRVILRNVLTGLRAALLGLSSKVLELSLIRFSKTADITNGIVNANSWRDVLAQLDSTRFAQFGNRMIHLYEEKNDLGEIELAIEDYIARKIKTQLIAFPFHLGTIIGFFSLKQYEGRNLRSIAVGVERGESAETIRRMITIW